MFFFVILIFFVLIVGYLQFSAFKGNIGEIIINFIINKKLDKSEYHLIKDITMTVRGGTTQIDHVIVSQYGIFVIETKNMKGWIFGGERQKAWMQTLPGGKFKFQNPLQQNYKHIKALAHMLDLTDDKFHSVIVFTGESTFKTSMPKNVLDKSYIDYIKSKREILFSYAQTEKLIKQIESIRYERGLKTNREYIKHLKQNHSKTRKEPSF